MNRNEQEHDKLRSLIRKALAKCTTSTTPKLSELLKSPSAYKKTESLVLNYAIKNGISIEAAIGQIESELL